MENLVSVILAGIEVLPPLFPLNFCPSFGATLILLFLCKWPLRICEENLVCDIVPKSIKENHVEDIRCFSDSSCTSCYCGLPRIKVHEVNSRTKWHRLYSYGFLWGKEKRQRLYKKRETGPAEARERQKSKGGVPHWGLYRSCLIFVAILCALFHAVESSLRLQLCLLFHYVSLTHT